MGNRKKESIIIIPSLQNLFSTAIFTYNLKKGEIMPKESKSIAASIAELKKLIKKLEKEVKTQNELIKGISKYLAFRDPILFRFFKGDKETGKKRKPPFSRIT